MSPGACPCRTLGIVEFRNSEIFSEDLRQTGTLDEPAHHLIKVRKRANASGATARPSRQFPPGGAEATSPPGVEGVLEPLALAIEQNRSPESEFF